MKKWLMILIAVITVPSLLFFSSEVFSFGRGRIFGRRCVSVSSSCAPVHSVVHTPVIHHDVVEEVVAYPILVPAFQFQYSPPAIQIPAQVTYAQPYAPQVQQQPYMNPQQPQQNFGNINIQELARAIIAEMNKQLNNGPPDVPNQPNYSNPSPEQPVQRDIGVVQYNALAALMKNCSSCHTGVGSKKGFVIFSQPGYFNPLVDLRKIAEAIRSGNMPPQTSNYHLNQLELNEIFEWLKSRGVD